MKAIISNKSQAESGELTWDCLVSLSPRSVRKRLHRLVKPSSPEADTMTKGLSKSLCSEDMSASRFGNCEHRLRS